MTENERKIILEIIELKKQVAELKDDEELLTELETQFDAYYHGYSSFYKYDDLPAEKDENWINKILDILTIYSFMINSISNNQNPPYNHSLNDVAFPGFDGNNELDELLFVKYLLVKENRFSEIRELCSDDFNSHSRMMPKYERMMKTFERIGKPVLMTDADIESLLKS